MKFELTYSKRHNCLMGKFIGDLNVENVRAYSIEVAKLANIHNCKRFINDLREANILLSMADFFHAPSKVSVGPFDRSWKRAIIVKQKEDKLDFFETASLNQGFRVKVFEDIDEALEWL